MKIFIIGGTSGMGLALAKFYIEKGHEVGVCGRSIEKISEEHHLKKYKSDVTEIETLELTLNEFIGNQSLDLLINFAGSYADDITSKITYEQAEDMLKTNILGTVNAFEIGRKAMKNQSKGQIVAIASVSGILDYPQSSLYTKTKRCVIQIAEAYRRALEPFGISVSVIVPGYVDTEKLRNLNNNDLSKKPFLVPEDEAVKLIAKAIAQKKKIYVFPKKMKWLMKSLSLLPSPILNRLMYKKAKWMKED